ncbi:putative Brix domain, protein Peter Pan [Septoria linicola]|nr:putative Brix domain, protein Peter Pan [Septoria linicola]
MAKRRTKKYTHVGAAKGGIPQAKGPQGIAKATARSPKSMVIRVGASEVGHSVSQLVKDVRSMMEPDTASRLKERRSNKLRDYTTMAGPLGVTNLMLFSKSESGNTNLRLAYTPRGPTLHFRVEKYSLCKDIYQSMKRPKSGGQEYLTAPLLVMNNFISKDWEGKDEKEKVKTKQLEDLVQQMFQGLFPPVNPTRTPLSGIKRVLLLDRVPKSTSPDDDSAPYVLNVRHFAIETRTAKSVPKPLRRLDAAEKLSHTGQKRKRALPNLGKLNDVADYLLDPTAADGFTSGSDSEAETDAEVEITTTKQRKVSKHAKKATGANGTQPTHARDPKENVEKKGIKLYELGPRMKLRLTKVEEGMCGGKVMWHEYINKSEAEVKEMEKVHQKRNSDKAARKAEQKANVDRKKAEKAARKANGETVDEEEDEEEVMDMYDDEWDDDDDQYTGPGASDDEMEDDGEGGNEDGEDDEG